MAAFAAPVKDGIGCKFEGLVCIDDRQPLGATGLGFAPYRHSAMAGASAGCVVALALRSPAGARRPAPVGMFLGREANGSVFTVLRN